MTVNGEQSPAYLAGTGPEDFAVADELPDGEVPADGGGQDEAPFGWTRDRTTGELRAKKRPGRPKTPPGAEELAAAPLLDREPDRPPAPPADTKRATGPAPAPAPAPQMPRGGIIAAGIDKLYRRAGKILRAIDHDIGQALIECTKAELLEEGELTVGQAWEQLAKANPRIRAFLLRAIAGGAWSDLIMAHAPVGVAVMMKPAIQRLIPFGKIIESVAEPDDDTPDGEGGLPGGMTAADFEQLKQTAAEQARRVAARMGMPVTDAELAEAAAQVTGQGGFPDMHYPPAAFRRTQPRASSRAQRSSKGR